MASATSVTGEVGLTVQETTQHRTRKNFVFTHPRTASNVLKRLLNLDHQPSLIHNTQRDYHFRPLVGYRYKQLNDRHIVEWTPDELAAVTREYERCLGGIEEHVRQSVLQDKDVFVLEHLLWMVEPVAENNWALDDDGSDEVGDRIKPYMAESLKQGYGKERSQFNQTIFPDEWLMTWLPTILIRHPALLFPSLYRTGVDLQGKEFASRDPKHVSEMTWRWSRSLFEFYKQKHETNASGNSQWPIVLDADDVISDPGVIRKYCEIVGLEPTVVKYEWAAVSQEELERLDPMLRRMFSTLSSSTGIVAGKTSVGLDIDEEVAKWRVEFGDKEGKKMERWVRAAMPDYEYMRDHRLRVDGE